MILTEAPAHSLGEADLRRMQRQGWRFANGGVRVANGWAMLATNPRGHYEMVVVADPGGSFAPRARRALLESEVAQ